MSINIRGLVIALSKRDKTHATENSSFQAGYHKKILTAVGLSFYLVSV